MVPTPLPKVVEIFHSTLSQLEEPCHPQQDDPAVLELKTQIVETIADLETRVASPQENPVTAASEIREQRSANRDQGSGIRNAAPR